MASQRAIQILLLLSLKVLPGIPIITKQGSIFTNSHSGISAVPYIQSEADSMVGVSSNIKGIPQMQITSDFVTLRILTKMAGALGEGSCLVITPRNSRNSSGILAYICI